MSTKPIWSWRHAIEETNVKAPTKALAFVIANDLTDTGKFSQMPIEDLARRSGMNVRSAETHVKNLKKAGLLSVTIRRDAAGHPIGRKFSPKFPASFTLPSDEAQTENLAVRDCSQTANFDSQTAKNDSQTANLAGIYKETSSQTSPQTSNTEQQAAPSAVSFDEFWASLPSSMKKGKALAKRHWAKLSQVQRNAAKNALPSYLRTDEPKRGYYKHGSTYLSDRVWEDYETTQADEVKATEVSENTKVLAVALDLAYREWRRAAQWWQSLNDVPSRIKEAAVRHATENFPEFQLQAA